jgi:hypothetical protein
MPGSRILSHSACSGSPEWEAIVSRCGADLGLRSAAFCCRWGDERNTGHGIRETGNESRCQVPGVRRLRKTACCLLLTAYCLLPKTGVGRD